MEAKVDRAPLIVAAAQPPCIPGDVAQNARAHARSVVDARARLVVFPELSLTGYVLTAAPLDLDAPVLDPLLDACATTGTLALVGGPVADPAGGRSIAVLRVSVDGVRVLYRKTFLGGDEPAHFTAGSGPATVDVDGWRIGLGVCKDTGTPEHVRATAALGVDVYAAGLVHRPHELAEQDARGRMIASACAAHVVFASAAGPAGGDYERTAGTSSVWSPERSVLARVDATPGAIARALIAPVSPT
jgi:predicted amidohydrolase